MAEKPRGTRRGGHQKPRQTAFGRLVRVFRERAALTQAQLAMRLGLSQASIAQWERGESFPELETAAALAAVLHTTVDELLGGPPGARIVHYHVPGEMRIQVAHGGLVVLGNYGPQDLEQLLATWRALREGEDPAATEESPPSSLGCAEDDDCGRPGTG